MGIWFTMVNSNTLFYFEVPRYFNYRNYSKILNWDYFLHNECILFITFTICFLSIFLVIRHGVLMKTLLCRNSPLEKGGA